MAKLLFQKQKLIQQATDQLRESLAIYMIMFHLKNEVIEDTQAAVRDLPTMTKSELREIVEKSARNLKGMRKYYEITASSKELLRILSTVESAPQGKSVFITKHSYLKLAKVAHQRVKDFDHWPSHTRVELRLKATPVVEISLLETRFFEDMCSMYNAWSKIYAARGKHAKKIEIKHESAQYRAALVAVFNFVECFLNGLAYEYYLDNEIKLPQKVKDQLREWDSETKRARYVNFRKKLLDYPKIISGDLNPPLQEGHCPEMKLLVEKSKVLRDAISHASPGPHPEELDSGKEDLILNSDREELNQAVDAAIGLARKLNIACKHKPERVWWIQDRDPTTGLFLDSVFD